jgi:hypothetical protein
MRMTLNDAGYAAASILLLGGAGVLLCAATVALSALAGRVLYRWTQRPLDDLLTDDEPDLGAGWVFTDLSEQWVRDQFAEIVARWRHPAGKGGGDDAA